MFFFPHVVLSKIFNLQNEKCTIENNNVPFYPENFNYLDVKEFFHFNERINNSTINNFVNNRHYNVTLVSNIFKKLQLSTEAI